MDDSTDTVVRLVNDVLLRLLDMRPGDIMTIEASHDGVGVLWAPGLFREQYPGLFEHVTLERLEELRNG